MAYKPTRSTTPAIHPWASDYETKIIRGEACARAAVAMREAGWSPDIIVGHPGWGEMLFLRDIWPAAPQLHFLEFFYRVDLDVSFDPEFPQDGWQAAARIRAKNASGLLSLSCMDAAYSPTEWQRTSYPDNLHQRIEVIHDGIDTDHMVPANDAKLTVNSRNLTLHTGMEIVTFINRNLEPYRGYHSFMRSLPALMKARPNALIVIVGGESVSYGAKAPDGNTWKQIFLDEVADRVDMSRLLFVGSIPYQAFRTLMQVSACHVYLTYPFVLSWSMLEAMSCGVPLIGSATPPVEEVVKDGHNGLLVGFRDYEGLADRVASILGEPERYREMRVAARQTIIDRYDLKRVCLPKQIALVESMVPGAAP